MEAYNYSAISKRGWRYSAWRAALWLVNPPLTVFQIPGGPLVVFVRKVRVLHLQLRDFSPHPPHPAAVRRCSFTGRGRLSAVLHRCPSAAPGDRETERQRDRDRDISEVNRWFLFFSFIIFHRWNLQKAVGPADCRRACGPWAWGHADK